MHYPSSSTALTLMSAPPSHLGRLYTPLNTWADVNEAPSVQPPFFRRPLCGNFPRTAWMRLLSQFQEGCLHHRGDSAYRSPSGNQAVLLPHLSMLL